MQIIYRHRQLLPGWMDKSGKRIIHNHPMMSCWRSARNLNLKDNALQDLASTSTERDGLGLAQMLYEQMKRNYNL